MSSGASQRDTHAPPRQRGHPVQRNLHVFTPRTVPMHLRTDRRGNAEALVRMMNLNDVPVIADPVTLYAPW